jgi:hypothetical protein
MSLSFAFSCASSSASTLYSGRSAACEPDGPAHAACLSTAATPAKPDVSSGTVQASNYFSFPDFAHHLWSLGHEDGAPRLYSSSKCCGTDAVFVAVLLCLGSIVNVAAAELAACAVWSTAALSLARGDLVATSLPNQGLAVIAGGRTGLFFLFQG